MYRYNLLQVYCASYRIVDQGRDQMSVPLTVSIPLAGILVGVSRPTAYRLHLPVLDLPGRKKVAVADLERLVGTKITADHIAEAQAKLERSPSGSQRSREPNGNRNADIDGLAETSNARNRKGRT